MSDIHVDAFKQVLKSGVTLRQSYDQTTSSASQHQKSKRHICFFFHSYMIARQTTSVSLRARKRKVHVAWPSFIPLTIRWKQFVNVRLLFGYRMLYTKYRTERVRVSLDEFSLIVERRPRQGLGYYGLYSLALPWFVNAGASGVELYV